MMKEDDFKIAAVVVTFNRLELLKKCVEAIRNQTRKLDEIIVINNSSSDGTEEWLNEQKDLTVITQENSGSAGGQYTGIKTAYEKGYDWTWSLDCDVIAKQNALEKLIYSEIFKFEQVGFLTSNILDRNDKVSYINIPYLKSAGDVLEPLNNSQTIEVISSSFGSVLFNRDAITKVGYPIPEFFIWGDDVEYTMRIIHNGFRGYLIFESIANHLNEDNFKNPFQNLNMSSNKAFYAIRNTVYTIKLRNRLFKNSYLRGYLGVLKFYLENLYMSLKIHNWEMFEYVNFTKLVLTGLFFNPKIKP